MSDLAQPQYQVWDVSFPNDTSASLTVYVPMYLGGQKSIIPDKERGDYLQAEIRRRTAGTHLQDRAWSATPVGTVDADDMVLTPSLWTNGASA